MVKSRENPVKIYYLMSNGFKIFNIIISVIFTAIPTLLLFAFPYLDADENIVILSIIFFIIVALILDIWTCYVLLMRIKIDYIKQTILVFYRYGIKKFKFNEINDIQINEIDGLSFEVFLSTDNSVLNVRYAKYSKNKVTDWKLYKVNDIKNSLNSLPQKRKFKEIQYNSNRREGTFKFYKTSNIIYVISMTCIMFVVLLARWIFLDVGITTISADMIGIAIFIRFIFLSKEWLMMRIKINLNKKSIYIYSYGINEEFDFKDIKELSIIQDYNEVSFKFRIVTSSIAKEIVYNKYSNQNITDEQRQEIMELKVMMNKISDEIEQSKTNDGAI